MALLYYLKILFLFSNIPLAFSSILCNLFSYVTIIAVPMVTLLFDKRSSFNDQIYNYISDYIDGVLTREQFWILAKFKYPIHQITFCTQEALTCISYQSSEEVFYERKRR